MGFEGEFSAAPEKPAASVDGRATLPHAAPLGVWLALQLLALLAAALQVPFSDQFARPAERVAIHEMLIVQIAAAGLLMPLLLRRIDTSLMIAATAWPFLQLAGVLSSTPTGRVALAGAYLTGWIAVLAAWRWILPGRAAQLAGSAVAGTLALGGAILWYLRAEFVRQSATPQWPTDAHYGPIVAAIALVEGTAMGAAWAGIGLLAFLTLIVIALRLRRR